MKNYKNFIKPTIVIYLLVTVILDKCSEFPCENKTVSLVFSYLVDPFLLISLVYFICFYLLWKVPIFNKLLKFIFDINPVLKGTWSGTMYCEFDKSVRPVFLTIEQPNAFSLECNYFTENRISKSYESFIMDSNHLGKLIYAYAAEEDYINHKKNPTHQGTAMLDIKDNRQTLEGQYYTNNNTQGKISVSRKSYKIADSFKNAQQLCFPTNRV